jgi:hypothetical protein
VPSTKNAVIAHEFEVRDSGVSTTTSADRAKHFALSMHDPGGETSGVVYKIDTSALLRYQIDPFVVSSEVAVPRFPEDQEVILVRFDFGELPWEIVAEHYEVYR